MTDDARSPGRFSIDGALTIRNADSTLQRLRAQLDQNQVLEVDTSGATEFDVSGIQLILAARASARMAGKTLIVAQPLSSAVHAALVQGGFLRADGGTDDKNSFWLGGGV